MWLPPFHQPESSRFPLQGQSRCLHRAATSQPLPASFFTLPCLPPSLSYQSKHSRAANTLFYMCTAASTMQFLPLGTHTKQILKEVWCFCLSMWLCVEHGWLLAWLGHNHLPSTNKPERGKPMGALGVGKEKGFRVVAQSSRRLLDLEWLVEEF